MAQPGKRVTLTDIARLAGVGVGTASRALSGSPKIAESTREKVLEVAKRLDYIVSPDASSLARGRTGRVALVVPHLSRWFFGAVTEAITSVLRAAGLDVLLYAVGDLHDRHHFFEHLPARRKVDGVLVVAFPVEELERRRLELMGVQIVAVGGQTASYPHVHIDDYTAAHQAMNHLLFLGHRRIAMLEARDPDQPHLDPPRSRAYHAALREHHLQADPQLVISSNWGGEEGAQAMARLISNAEPPTAVFAHSDEVALGAMRTVRRAGLHVPRDISIVGIDDHPLAALTDLTTVRQPIREQGEQAAQMLIALLRGDDVDRAVTLETELVVRASTAPPPTR